MKKVAVFLFAVALCLPISAKALDLELAPEAKSAILMDVNGEKIMYEKDAHKKLAPASMTKIMSMLLILEELDKGTLKWDQQITVSKHAASMGGSQIFLEEGEKMAVKDLFKGLAVGSANDAVVALGEAIAGTEDAFVTRMNQRAKQLGLKDTNFKNTTGFDEANHYSSAYDMAMMAKEVLKHEEVLEYTSIYEDYLRPDTEKKFWLVNTNKVVCEESIK